MKIKNSTENQNYNMYKGNKKIIFICVISFLIGVSYNIPFKKIINKNTIINIISTRKCPISYKDISFSYLGPKIIIKNLIIHGRCFNNNEQDFYIDQLNIGLGLPGIIPPRIKFNVKAFNDIMSLNIYPQVGLTNKKLVIEKSNINAKVINMLIGMSGLLDGKLNIIANAIIKNNHIKGGMIKIDSKNFVIPSQRISGFDVPNLNFKKLSLEANYNTKDEIKINNINIGNKSSPINAQIKGMIKLNKFNVRRSGMRLEGKIKFSDQFITSFPLIKVLLSGKNQSNGFYKFKLGGTIGSPSKPQFL